VCTNNYANAIYPEPAPALPVYTPDPVVSMLAKVIFMLLVDRSSTFTIDFVKLKDFFICEFH
jgi:hypothetical protein